MSLSRFCIFWSRLSFLINLPVCRFFAHQYLNCLLIGTCTPSEFLFQSHEIGLFSHRAWWANPHVCKIFAGVQIYVFLCFHLLLTRVDHVQGNLRCLWIGNQLLDNVFILHLDLQGTLEQVIGLFETCLKALQSTLCLLVWLFELVYLSDLVEDQSEVSFIFFVLLVDALAERVILLLERCNFGAKLCLAISEAHIFDTQFVRLLSQLGVLVYHFLKWAQDILNTKLFLLGLCSSFGWLTSQLSQVFVTGIVLAANLLHDLVLQSEWGVCDDVHQFGWAQLLDETLNGVVRRTLSFPFVFLAATESIRLW